MENILMYFNYPFVRYAFIVAVLISLCASLLGVTLVLKRFSYIGDGLSHVAFGAIAIASVLNLTNSTPLVLIVTIISAVFLLNSGQNAKIKGDAQIAMISVGALAVGYLLMSVFSTSANLSGDVCTTLFGSTSIMTLKKSDVIICLVLSILVIFSFIFFYNKIFAVTFDENFARAVGTKVNLWQTCLAILTAVIIVIAMNLAGSLLVSALIIFPALSAMRIFRSFFSVTLFSAVFGVLCSATATLLSIVFETPVGATVVAAEIVMFGLCSIVGSVRK